MYSPSTYWASETKVLRRRVYRCSRRKSSIFCWMREMRCMIAVVVGIDGEEWEGSRLGRW